MKRVAKSLGLFGALVALGACSAIIGTRDLELAGDDGGTDGGGSPLDATNDTTQSHVDGGVDAPSDSPVVLPDGSDAANGNCVADFQNDVHNCGRCGHDCVGGQCTLGVCQPVTIVQGQPGAMSIAVDATNIFWTGNYNDQILKADKDGKNVIVLAHDPAGNVSYPFGIALDDTNVYWTNAVSGDTDPGRIARCPKTGALGGAATRITAGDLDAPHFLSVDGTHLFWSNNDVYGGIGRALEADGGQMGFLVTNERNLFDMTIDDASVYFVSQVNVGRVAKSAPAVLDASADAAVAFQIIYTPPASSQNALYGTGVAVDDTSVYWTENNDPNGAIRYAPKHGLPDGGIPTIVSEKEVNPYLIVVDATNIYWTSQGTCVPDSNSVCIYSDSYVATCPKSGCINNKPTILVSSLHNARGIALDDQAVYVTYYGNPDTTGAINEGGIIKIAKP